MRRALSLLSLAVVLGAGPATAQDDPVAAIVDGQRILRSEVEAAQRSLPDQYRQVPLEMLWAPLVDRAIDMRLLSGAAEREKLAEDPAVRKELDRARQQVLQTAMVERAIERAATPERLQQAYNLMRLQPGFAQEEVRAAHVLVASEEEAKAVLAELTKGGDFAAIAAERSIDPSAKQNGGDLGWFARGMMVEEFSEAAFTIPPGSYGEAPVQTQFGWHVLKVEEKRLKVPSFEEKEAEIRDQVARESVAALLQQVRDAAVIERFNIDGSPKPN